MAYSFHFINRAQYLKASGFAIYELGARAAAVAIKLTNGLALGFGVDFVFSKAEWNHNIDFPINPDLDHNIISLGFGFSYDTDRFVVGIGLGFDF